MDEEKQKLKRLHNVVHGMVKTLKLNEHTAIQYGKEFIADDVKSYMLAYSYHKRKWFNVKDDKASRTLYVERVEPPPLIKHIIDEDEEI